MPTYKLTLEYEGTRYSGWQAQGNTQKTIQGHLLRAAREVLGDADIGGAGRTDAGVHASGQVAHLRAHKALDPQQLARRINDFLPPDINILDAVRVRDGFHARHDAVSRVYLYQVSTRRTAFAKPFVWWIKDRLDADAMKSAAAAVAGRHDFSAFSDKRLKEDESRIVVVERCELARAGDLILVRIAASHFLWKMVRKLISYFVEIGRGNIAAGDVTKRLHAKGEYWAPTAPPSGLFLEGVVYERETFDRPLEPIVPVERRRPAGWPGGVPAADDARTGAETAPGQPARTPALRTRPRSGR
jgi:tRNA pseudouridine38-40 synthase